MDPSKLAEKLVEQGLSLVFNFVLVLAVGVLAWCKRARVSQFLNALRVKKIGLSAEGVTIELFEAKMVRAYEDKGLGPPSENDRRRIRSIREYMVPVVAGRRVLWVDDRPAGNRIERAAFVELQIDVQACRTTAEAQRELGENGFDLVISDWTRERPDDGLRFLEHLRTEGRRLPVIFYHGMVSPEVLADRRRLAHEKGAVGTTASPGELLQWTVAELARIALRDERAMFFGLSP